MKINALSSGAVLLMFTLMNADAQTPTTPADPDTTQLLAQLASQKSLLDAQTALSDAQAKKAKSEQDLATQLAAPDKAAQTERETDLTNAITKLKDVAATMPTGTVTTSTGMMTTPATAALGLKATEELAETVATAIAATAIAKPLPDGSASTTKPAIVFIDKLPSSADTLQFQYWLEAADELEKKFIALKAPIPELTVQPGGEIQPKSLVGTVALLGAVPSAINTIAGLFRSDYTEKTGDFTLDSSGFQSFVVAKLSGKAEGKEIYTSLDSFAASRLISPSKLQVTRRIARIQEARIVVGDAAAKVTAETDQKQGQLDAYKNGLSSLNAAADAIRNRRLEIEEKITSAGSGKDEANERLLKLLDDRLAKADKAVSDARGLLNPVTLGREIAVLKEKTRRLAAIQSELSDFITTTVGTASDGQLKVLTLFRQELLHQACFPSDFTDGSPFPKETKSAAERATANGLYFVTLSVRLKPQSVIEKKSLFSRAYFTAGLLAVDYQVGSADGKLIKADALWQGYAEKMPEPTERKSLKP